MKNVLVISRELFPFTFGGFARLLSEYLRRVCLFEYQVLTWYNQNRKDGERIKFIQIKQSPFFHNIRYLRALWFAFIGFIKSIKQDFDAVVGIGFNGSILAIPLGLVKGKPRISIIYDVDLVKKEISAYGFWGRLIRRLILKFIFRFSNKIMCGSEKSKQDIVEIFSVSSKRINVNPPGVELPANIPPLEDTLNGPEVKLLSVGSLSPKEGIEYIIDAVTLLVEKHKGIKLYIVGKELYQNYVQFLKQKVMNSRLEDHIVFMGRVESVWPYYKACDIFVVASYNQKGFSMPVIEASSMGKPVIATRYLEQVGVLQHERTGLVVPDKNSIALADAIDKLIKDKDLMNRLGNNGKIFVKKFDWNVSTQNFERRIAEVLDQKN